MGQKEDILHLALIFHGLEMPMHRNHKTSKENVNCTREEDKKDSKFLLFVKKQK